MHVLRGDITRTNGFFLLGVAPVLARIWIEAVVWRLDEGPQMLGFQLMHLAAGAWTAPLFASLLVLWLYQLWAIAIGLRVFVPSWRRSTQGKRLVALGVASLWLFLCIGEFIQSELGPAAIFGGAAVMGGLFVLMVLVALRRPAAWLRRDWSSTRPKTEA